MGRNLQNNPEYVDPLGLSSMAHWVHEIDENVMMHTIYKKKEFLNYDNAWPDREKYVGVGWGKIRILLIIIIHIYQQG